jgi:hypothetical protein
MEIYIYMYEMYMYVHDGWSTCDLIIGLHVYTMYMVGGLKMKSQNILIHTYKADWCKSWLKTGTQIWQS